MHEFEANGKRWRTDVETITLMQQYLSEANE